MIIKLNEEQIRFKEIVKKEYINRLNQHDIDKAILLKGISFVYGKMKKVMPKVFISNDPLLAVKRAKKFCKNLSTVHYFGIGYDSGWCSFYDYFLRLGIIKSELMQSYLDLIKCGVFSYIFLDKVVVAIENPIFVKRNERKQMHCTNGPCIKWGGGFEMYRLNGVRMTKEQVMTPAEQIDINSIIKEQNVEIRRELIRKVGIERFIQKSGAKVLDKKGEYELLSINLSDEVSDARYLKMKNPSIDVWHVEGVEGDTVQEALNWRAGNMKEKWSPKVLT